MHPDPHSGDFYADDLDEPLPAELHIRVSRSLVTLDFERLGLHQRLTRQLALERIDALTERRAQPGMQVEGGGFGHNARITDRGRGGFGAFRTPRARPPAVLMEPILECDGFSLD